MDRDDAIDILTRIKEEFQYRVNAAPRGVGADQVSIDSNLEVIHAIDLAVKALAAEPREIVCDFCGGQFVRYCLNCKRGLISMDYTEIIKLKELLDQENIAYQYQCSNLSAPL